MKKQICLSAFMLLFIFHQNLFADSPLTSTAISEAYKNEKIVQQAAAAEGVLNTKLMKYLSKRRKPIALKIALINELGWKLGGKNNAALFWAYLQKKYKYKDMEDFLKRADGNTLICMAYLKALDDYQEVSEAIKIAQKAKSKNKDSYTINIICALIEAQKAQDSDWCKCYTLTNEVRKNKALTRDMNEEAIKIIFEYMDLYKEYC